MRLLVIEDSQRLRENLAIGLRRAGYAVDVCGDGNQGLHQAKTSPYDVIILDLMLPGRDGLSVLQQLRASKTPSCVLILTARDRLEDKVEGLRRGADDYLVKPFAFEELLARIEALIRRKHASNSPLVTFGQIEIDTAGKTVSRQGQRLDLSQREFAILQYLALRRGQIVSRSDIEDHVYDENADLNSNVVDTVIYSLRKKLDQPGVDSCIRTHRGMGYELVEETA